MKDNQSLIMGFYDILSSEINDLPITISINEDEIIFNYNKMNIKTTKSRDVSDASFHYIENDLINGLCRARLLIVEKFNRKLPNEKRHSFFKDIRYNNIKNPFISFFKTDMVDDIFIKINEIGNI